MTGIDGRRQFRSPWDSSHFPSLSFPGGPTLSLAVIPKTMGPGTEILEMTGQQGDEPIRSSVDVDMPEPHQAVLWGMH